MEMVNFAAVDLDPALLWPPIPKEKMGLENMGKLRISAVSQVSAKISLMVNSISAMCQQWQLFAHENEQQHFQALCSAM